MANLEDSNFPIEVAEKIIKDLSINEDNLMELKDIIHFVNELSPSEVSDLINQIFDEVQR